MNDWEEVKSRVSIEEIISEYVPSVKSSGANFRCVCPFHKEKTPSLMISPQKQIWHCFGCGVGGDVFGFVSQIENISKLEALKKIAKKTGYELKSASSQENTREKTEEDKKNENEFQKGIKILEWTSRVYHQILMKFLQDRQHSITQYCLERNLNQKIIEKFKIGYAPRSNFLLELAKKHNLDLDILHKTGLLNEKEGFYKDKFTDRLIIPVFNKDGDVAGFTGRVLPYDKTERPKYLNSPQTPWFDKSKIWFGWHLAKKEIIAEKKALIVEGNMDVIASFSKNLCFTLASQGTSFTPKQLRLLKQVTKTIWLAFDNDQAGQIASKKFFKAASSIGLEVKKVVIPPQFKDLDDYLTSFEGAEIDQDNFQIEPFLEYFIYQKQASLTSTDIDKQKETILEVAELMAVLDELSFEQYLKKLSEITQISKNTLKNIINKAKKTQQYELKQYKSTEKEAEDLRKDIDSQNAILTAWQKIAGFYLFSEQRELVDIALLDSIYFLLKDLITENLDSPDFSDYIEKEKKQLELIWDEEMKQKDTNYVQVLIKSIKQYIDQNIEKFIIDKEKQEIYFAIKKLV